MRKLTCLTFSFFILVWRLPAQDSEIAVKLQGLLILPSLDQVQMDGVTGITGVKIMGPKFLDIEAVNAIVTPHLGKQLNMVDLRTIQTNLVKLCQKQGHPVVDVCFPEHVVKDGVVQLAVIEGKLGKVTVENPGRKWYSDKWILGRMGLKPGEPLTQAELDRGLERLNGNADFRQVNAAFIEGANLGDVDVALKVDDRFPLRPHFGVDDASQTIFGTERLRMGLTYGNVFGLDHVLDYEYATDFSFNELRSHTATYIAPLPWGHSIGLMGNYSELNPDLSRVGFPDIENRGVYYQASARYNAPLPGIGAYRHDLYASYDHKHSDNQLLFNSNLAANHVPVDVDQFTFGYDGRMEDPWGQTSFNFRGVWSPGGLSQDNTDTAFEASRPLATADYYYLLLDAERVTKLWGGFSEIASLTWQETSDRLPYSEQAYIGGFSTVRGYDERAILGDKGLVIRNELRTPVIPFAQFDRGRIIGVQFLGFYDYGSVQLQNIQPNERVDPSGSLSPKAYLDSVGAGIRVEAIKHLTARCDYGFQLHQDPTLSSQPGYSNARGRVHFSINLAF